MTHAPLDETLDTYLAPFTTLAGDRRTAQLLGATVRGILGSESLVCARIAAFSPSVGAHAAERAPDSPYAHR